MISFHKVSLDDERLIRGMLEKEKDFTCEYTFGNIISYCGKMDILIAEVCDCLVTKCVYEGYVMYCYPIGDGNKTEACRFILNDSETLDGDFEIFGIPPEGAELLRDNFGDRLRIFIERDTFDYVYHSSDLIKLSGKKYQPKRNHISYFEKNNNWSYETISTDNIDECLEMSRKWLEYSREEYKKDLEDEYKIICRAFENYDKLGFVGGLLRVDSQVVAYTFGERMTDEMFCVHIEKAFSHIRGAYPMINRQFVLNELSEYKYINREDDTGAENLRKAKLSYYPCFLMEKYEAKPKNVD